MGRAPTSRAPGGGCSEPPTRTGALAGELHRLVDADLVAVLACTADCDHPPGCDRPECRGRLTVRAALGNARTDFAGAAFDGRRDGRGWEDGSLRRAEELCRVGEVALTAAEDRTRAPETAVTRERRRLAREMHDTVGQLLFGTGVAARAARGSVAALPVSMADAVEAFRHRAGIGAGIMTLGTPRALGSDREHLLPRVVGEGLRNAERHSGAREVIVCLSFEDGVPGEGAALRAWVAAP